MPNYTRTEIRVIVDDEDVTQYAPAPNDEIHQILKAARSFLEPLEYSTSLIFPANSPRLFSVCVVSAQNSGTYICANSIPGK